MPIPDTPLLAPTPFGPRMGAGLVGRAIAQGLRDGGVARADVCPVELSEGGAALERELERLAFDERLHRARALIVAAPRLERETLRGSALFELATRARQGGVPAFALAGVNRLDPFDARILDLQAILVAGRRRALRAGGRSLAQLLERDR